jgi:hypothetical protein
MPCSAWPVQNEDSPPTTYILRKRKKGGYEQDKAEPKGLTYIIRPGAE